MGNFSHLAQPVLKKVSCFPFLGQETGNFGHKTGNNLGNVPETLARTAQAIQGLDKETLQETSRKLDQNNEETFASESTYKNFISQTETNSVLDYFFKHASNEFKIELLPDDVRWLNTICYGIKENKLKTLIEVYISNWLEAMNSESVIHKKQNTGRFVANAHLRESLQYQLRSKK